MSQNRTEANQRDPMKESELVFTEDVAPRRTSNNGTMQNKFPGLDTFLICLAYCDLMVGISEGPNCF